MNQPPYLKQGILLDAQVSIVIAICLFIFQLSCFTAKCQIANPFNTLREVPIPSPNAASLIKAVEFPVSYYTGQPDISIPLYTVSSGDIKVPITLSYHASGIKVQEEAGIVGLGFALNAGGVITKSIQGREDYLYPAKNYFEKLFPGVTYHNTYDPDQSNILNWSGCNAYDSTGKLIDPNTQIGTEDPQIDGEPDLYIYNFGSFSGKFIHTGSKLYDIGRNRIKFTLYRDSIVAVTPDGYQYSFAMAERGSVGATQQAITALYLTRILSPTTGKQVVFRYKYLYDYVQGFPWQSDPRFIAQLPTFSEEFMIKRSPIGIGTNPAMGLTQTLSVTYTTTLYLDKIDFDEGYIQFNMGSRTDLYGLRLNDFSVCYKAGNVFKKYAFAYSYFLGQSTDYYLRSNHTYSGNALSYPTSFDQMRLKLLKLQELDNSNQKNQEYSFEYYEGGNYTLPYKSSWAVDFFGFNNGDNLNTTLIPSSRAFSLFSSDPNSVPSEMVNYMGANRASDPEAVKAGLLKKVIYPGKGSTEYEFESGTFVNVSEDFTPKAYSTINYSIVDIDTGVKRKTFTLGNTKKVVLSGSLFCNCGGNTCNCNGIPGQPDVNWDCGSLYISGPQYNVLYSMLEKYNDATKQFEVYPDCSWSMDNLLLCENSNHGDFTKTVSLGAGTYRLSANYPDTKTGELGSKMATITAVYDTSYFLPFQYGAGVRVKSITKSDPFTKQSLKKSYTYINGVVMRFPVFYWRKESLEFTYGSSTDVIYPGSIGTERYYWHYLYSNSVVPYSFSASGSLIGYSQVIETDNSLKLGKIIYQYENRSDNFRSAQYIDNLGIWPAYFPGVATPSHLTNGFLKQVSYYDSMNTVVKEVTHTPLVHSPMTFWSFKPLKMVDPNIHSPEEPCRDATHSAYYFYPIQFGKVVIQSTHESELVQGTLFETFHQYEYNDLSYLKSETVTSSDGRQNVTTMTYPSDYTGVTTGWIQDLKVKNMLNSPLETMYKVGGLVVGGSFIKYKTVNTKTTPNQVYRIETSIPKAISSTLPNGTLSSDFQLRGTLEYDTHGNLSYSNATNDIVTSYLWGYSNSKAIASATGALPSDIFYQSFEEAGGNSLKDDSHTGHQSKIGGYSQDLAGLTNGNYTLSWWAKIANNTWKLQDSTVSVVSNAFAIKLSGQVDDVRFHPLLAKMNTYTYDFLEGITSVSDDNNMPRYYEYDSFGRLKAIRNNKGKVLKTFMYHYAQ